MLVVLSVPLVVALVALRHPHWYPYADSAVLELRLRDVWTSHTPLVGAIGRFGDDTTLANHPGPLGLYVLWPVYRALGSTAWAMAVASVTVHLAAMATILWIAFRRGGTALALGMAALLAVLVHGYGPSLLADAWNPFVPLLWWLVVLLAVWSVVCDDLVLLPVAVAAASLCAQSHVSYVGTTVALGLFAVGWAIMRAWRDGEASRRRLWRWVLVAGAVGIVLWLPPVVEELQDSPGNLTELWSAFANPTKPSIGFGRGLEVLLTYLNPWTMLTHGLGHEKIEFAPSAIGPGLALVAVWAASVLATWWLGDRSLRRLDVVVALTLVLGFFSCSRVVGDVLSYLFLWIWGLAALMVLAVGWSVVVLAQVARPRARERRTVVAAAGLLVATLVVTTSITTVDATGAHIDDARVSSELGRLVGPTAAALRRREAAEHRGHQRYLVTWVDPINFGLQGFGLVDELERRGFDVGADPYFAGAVSAHRVLAPQEATAVVHLAVGADIQKWEAERGATRVAYYDPRTRAQRAEYRRLHDRVVTDMVRSGLRDEARQVDDNLVTVFYYDHRLPARTTACMRRMIDLGLDLAVYVAPPDTRPA